VEFAINPCRGVLIMDFVPANLLLSLSPHVKSFPRARARRYSARNPLSVRKFAQLEQAYKARLLDRSAKSVELTPAGEVLFEYAEKFCACATNPFRLLPTAAT